MSKEKLFVEVNNSDPRYRDNKDVDLNKASLGQFAEILDVVFNPGHKLLDMIEVYGDFIGCDPAKVIQTEKAFPVYRSRLLRYTLPKVDGYKFSPLQRKQKIDESIDLVAEKSLSFDTGENSLEIIEIGPNKTTKIPKFFTFGVEDSKGRKFCLMTSQDWDAIRVLVYFEKGSSGEAAVDDFFEDLLKKMDELNYYKRGKIDPTGHFLEIPDLDWDDIELSDDIKSKIQNNIVDIIKKEKIYLKNGIPSKRGLLFAGKPGTGKTLAMKILANQLKEFTFIWVTPSNLHGTQDVQQIYDMARELAPTIVLLEDADLFCLDRSYNGGNPILGEILNQLDGLVELKGVITVMTSNKPGALDKALIERPGRFDVQIVFDPPKEGLRQKILAHALSKVQLESGLLERAAKETDGLTGAQLKELANLCVIYAIDEDSLSQNDIAQIKRSHLDKALLSTIRAKELSEAPDQMVQIKNSYLEQKENEEIIKESVEPEKAENPPVIDRKRSLIQEAIESKIPRMRRVPRC